MIELTDLEIAFSSARTHSGKAAMLSKTFLIQNKQG